VYLKVEEVIGYPRFGLKKKGIWVKVEAWNDDPETVEVLRETWIKVTGLQTKWCEWNNLDQVVSICGLLLDIDWLSVFRKNSQEVRVKVNCRDPSRHQLAGSLVIMVTCFIWVSLWKVWFQLVMIMLICWVKR
jgi:hypothetical protein